VTYSSGVITVAVNLPDEVASRAESMAAERGVTIGELASEALAAYLGDAPTAENGSLSFIGAVEASPGFSARDVEERLEHEGFEASPSS
jgi:hypothetical protein